MSDGEAFSRVKIDGRLREAGRTLADGPSVRYEYVLPDGTRADYVLRDRNGRAMAVAKGKGDQDSGADSSSPASFSFSACRR